MAKSILTLLIVLTFFFITPTTFAQLANTGWPTVYHDMQRTNRTNAIGPQTEPSATKWRKNLPQRFGGGSNRGVTIGTNGRSIYLAGGFSGIYSLNKNTGAIEWQRFAEQGFGPSPCPAITGPDNEKWLDMPPTIGIDGTLYATTEYGWGMALNPENGGFTSGSDSGLKFKYYLCKTEQAPAIDNDTMYIGSWDGKFFAYKLGDGFSGKPTDIKDQSDSRIKWTFQFNPSGRGRLYTYGTPAIGNDGTVYFGFKGIYAFYKDQKCPGTNQKNHCAAQQKWFVPINEPLESGGALPFEGASIGPEGNVYMLHQNKLHAVSSDGRFLWSISTGSDTRGRMPAIDSNGTVYFGSDDGYLYAINPQGTTDALRIKWKFRLGTCNAYSNAIIDGNNTIYINTNCDAGKGRLYAVNPEGTEKWRFNTGVSQGFIHDQMIAMDSDGTIYFNTGQNEFGAIAGSGTQNSPTPFYLRSDFGGLGGQKDGKVDIQDFNILAGEFYLTGTTLKSNIINTGLSTDKVDIQDYNAFVGDYQAYLGR